MEDAAQALASLLASDVTGTINVASGTYVPIRELVLTLARMADGERLLAFGRQPLAADEPPRLMVDTTGLRNELGFMPRHALHGALETTLQW